MLKECERADKQEMNQGSWVKLNERLDKACKRKIAIEKAMEEIKDEETAFNLTDPDSKIMAGRQGSHSSYNVH